MGFSLINESFIIETSNIFLSLRSMRELIQFSLRQHYCNNKMNKLRL